jgi:protein-arginine kinase activator protein McsA
MSNRANHERAAKICALCETTFRPRNGKQRFCSSRCRLLSWAVKEIVKDYHAGKPAGARRLFDGLIKNGGGPQEITIDRRTS